MYIRGLIPRNLAELAEALQIGISGGIFEAVPAYVMSQHS